MMKIVSVLISSLVWSVALEGPVESAPAPPAVASAVSEQPPLPEDGCVYAGLGYSDRIFINVPAGVYQCRAQHWYVTPDVPVGAGMSPDEFTSVRAQAELAGDGCIYAGLGFSDGAVIRTAVGEYLCKSHHWDRR